MNARWMQNKLATDLQQRLFQKGTLLEGEIPVIVHRKWLTAIHTYFVPITQLKHMRNASWLILNILIGGFGVNRSIIFN